MRTNQYRGPHGLWSVRLFCPVILLLVLVTHWASAADPKRVLVLSPFGRDVAPFSSLAAHFKTTLARDLGEPLDIFEVPLDLARFGGVEGEAALVAFLEGRVKSHPVDLVVSIGAAGMQFTARHRETVFAGSPVLYVGASPRFVSREILEANATLVTQKINLPSMVEDILQMRPETTHIEVVFGSSELESYWIAAAQKEFERFTDRVQFTWLNDLTFEQLLERCSALPPNTFILHCLFVIDAAGVPCEQNEVLKRLHEVANAPLFAFFESEFGKGSIGGHLYRDIEVGANAAETAIRILRGERPGDIPPMILEEVVPVYDARELRRWGVSEVALPAGSEIHFKELSFWALYRWVVIGVLAFCSLQAALIIGLLVNRNRRRQGEAEAALVAEISSKFVNLAPNEVDREVEDAQRRLCQFYGLDFSTLWQLSVDTPEFFNLTHFYSALEGPQPPGRMHQDQYPWARQELLAGRVVKVQSINDLPSEAAHDADALRQFGIRSNLALPLSIGGASAFGLLGLGTMKVERKWPPAMVNRMQLVAQIFANALSRKRTEQAIRESEERLAAGADLAGLGYYEVDLGSETCFVDHRFSEVCGIPRDQRSGLRPLEFWLEHLHPDDRARVLEERKKLHDGTVDRISIEYRYEHPTDGLKWIHHTGGSAARGEDGRAIRTFGVARDITPQKQAELDIEELRGNLTHLTRVNSLGTLSGSLAHELNQPLGIILSNAQAAQEMLDIETPDLVELKEILSDIVAADRRASEVILRLRALLERGQVTLQSLELNGVIDEVLQLTRADFIGRGISVVTDLAMDLPPIAGDRVQLQQVVLNLVLNAAEAMAANRTGNRRLRLTTCLRQDRVRTSVRDEGTGLHADVETLFQPFYSTKEQGLGMGLSICRSIIAAHGGRLWAESNPGGGAVFHFELPLAAPADA